MMQAVDRQYAIQGRRNLEAERAAYMLEHMPANKAYRYAAEAAGDDPDEHLLKSFRDRYRGYREGWRGNPRRAIAERLAATFVQTTGFPPLSVDIETAASCDLACPFCFRQTIVTPDKVMRADLYFKIIDQCAELGVPSVKLNWRGEPLLNPRLPELVDYAKRKGILETIINTDAVKLTEETSRALIEAGLDLMIYSFDGGTKETYEKMRPGRFRPNRFEDVYGNIRRFAELRRSVGAVLPRTQIQMVLTEETYREQESFFDLFEDCVDAVSVKAYTERGGALTDLDRPSRDRLEGFLRARGLATDTPYWRDREGRIMASIGRLPCEQIFQRLMVSYNGSVSMCCYDWGNEYPIGYLDGQAIEEGMTPYLVTVEKIKRGTPGYEPLRGATLPARHIEPPSRVQTLKQIWDGEVLNRVRTQHLSDQLEAVPICRACPFKETYQWVQVTSEHETGVAGE